MKRRERQKYLIKVNFEMCRTLRLTLHVVVSTAPAFNSEPTELERQRENVSLRLKKAFGLSVDEESRKPGGYFQLRCKSLFVIPFLFVALNVETLLNCELSSVVKTTPLLPSPTFPIPGSSESLNKDSAAPETEPPGPPPPPAETNSVNEEKVVEEAEQPQPVLYYTPDEEEMEQEDVDKEMGKVHDEMDSSTNLVPPFNNPVYPSSGLSALSSTIGMLFLQKSQIMVLTCDCGFQMMKPDTKVGIRLRRRNWRYPCLMLGRIR